MMTEKQRLLNLLHENKISADDFKILLAALDKKPSGFAKMVLFLINPFQKITGWPALLLGIMIAVVMSYVCWQEKFYIFSILDIARNTAVPHPKVAFTFWLLLYQNAVNIGVLALVYILMAKLFRQKNVRIIDFFGMVAVARLPSLIVMVGVILVLKFMPTLQFLAIRPNLITSIYSLFVNVVILWQLAIYFYALKEASGLTGNKLIFAAFSSLILGTILTEQLTMFFVY